MTKKQDNPEKNKPKCSEIEEIPEEFFNDNPPSNMVIDSVTKVASLCVIL